MFRDLGGPDQPPTILSLSKSQDLTLRQCETELGALEK
jgi:hypothetical protein